MYFKASKKGIRKWEDILHFYVDVLERYFYTNTQEKNPLVSIWPKADFCQSLKRKNVVKHQAQRSCQFQVFGALGFSLALSNTPYS